MKSFKEIMAKVAGKLPPELAVNAARVKHRAELIPLLRERGIHTLGDARRASAATDLAGRISAVGH